MLGSKRLPTNFNKVLFAWMFVGLALGVTLVPAPVGPFVVDDPVQIDEGSASEAPQGAPSPCLPCAPAGGGWNTPLFGMLLLPSFWTREDALAGALFRLRLVRLHPPIGPPQTFFAGQVAG